MNIVQNISNVIENTSITLTKIERECGFPKSSIRKWSENIPNAEKVYKVAQYLGCTVDYLLTGKEKSPPQSEELTEDELMLLDMYGLLTDREKGEIVGEMRILTKNRIKQENVG